MTEHRKQWQSSNSAPNATFRSEKEKRAEVIGALFCRVTETF
jgi:hypothetical protein